jgi:hypothetical protein
VLLALLADILLISFWIAVHFFRASTYAVFEYVPSTGNSVLHAKHLGFGSYTFSRRALSKACFLQEKQSFNFCSFDVHFRNIGHGGHFL